MVEIHHFWVAIPIPPKKCFSEYRVLHGLDDDHLETLVRAEEIQESPQVSLPAVRFLGVNILDNNGMNQRPIAPISLLCR